MTYVFGDKFLLGSDDGDVVRVISYEPQYDTYTMDVFVKNTDRFKYAGQIISDIREEELLPYTEPEPTEEEIEADTFNPPVRHNSQQSGSGASGGAGGITIGTGGVQFHNPGNVTVIQGQAEIDKFIKSLPGATPTV